MADLEITFQTVQLPANTSGTLTVREDVGDTGTINNTNSTSLVDGQTTYTLSGFDGSSGNAIEPELSLDNSDDVSTATVSEPTDIVKAGPTAPTLSLDATRDTEIDLSWTDESPDSYNVYRAQASGSTTADYTLIAEPPGTTTSYTDTGLENGEQYYYRVTSETSGGAESSLSNEVNGTTTLPAPSLSLDASVEDEITVNYTFNDNSSDGDLVLERSQDAGSTWTSVATITTLSNGSYTDASLNDGTEYTYRGTRNTDHASTASGTPSATTILPAATNLSASAVRTTEVDLSWVVNADTGTQSVEYKESSGSTWQTFSTGLALSASTETVAGLSAGTSYDFRVDTVTQDTNSLSGVFTTTTVPPSPAGLTVTEVTDTPDVALSWSDVSGEDEYRVYRATSPGSALGDYTQIDSVTADTTTYTDTTAALGARYYYVVSAANTSGESSGSNEVRAEPNADELTESIAWDSEREWAYGEFTSNTTTDGSGNLVLAERNTDLSFSYDISITTGASTDDAEVRVIDADDNTLASARVEGDSTDSGTLTVSAANAGTLTLEANGEASDGTGTADASISDNFGHTVSISTSGALTSDSADYDYTYPESGTWTSPYWDYTTTTTASALFNTSTQPTDTNISAVIEPDSGTASSSVPLTPGSGGVDMVSVDSNDRYRVVVALTTDIVDGTTPTPVLDSLSLEAHTPTTNHTVTDTRETEADLSWNEISSCDGYEVYQSTSTPVTTADSLAYSNTDSAVTNTTITGLNEGVTYYWNVRCIYTGE